MNVIKFIATAVSNRSIFNTKPLQNNKVTYLSTILFLSERGKQISFGMISGVFRILFGAMNSRTFDPLIYIVSLTLKRLYN